ncbi:MAG: hypothetical protein OEZ14_02495 [Acidimicrobiia bacterium]|nr:hypothetical protein [Acidimicrobiia bacterium]MDH5519381.1 hypothetical protein [Acidimicrobiia bacterium]
MASSDLKRFMIPGALVIGGLTAGSMLAPVALAAADDDPTDTTESADTGDQTSDPSDSTESTDTTDDGRPGRGRHGHLDHHPGAEVLVETLGMTPEELRAAFAEGKSLADVAADQGVAVDELEAALIDAATERIDQALADDRIDADRAAELKDELADRIGEMMTRTRGDRMGREGGGEGPGGDHGEGRGPRGFGGGEVAELLGLTTDELRAALAEGQTLAEVAEAQGVSGDDLVAFLLDQLEERLDQAVENGRLDADEADEKLAEAAEHIEEHINADPGERPEGLGAGPRAGHGPRGHHDGADDGANPDGGGTDIDGETVESSLDV